jgi:hypothetical protein
MDTCLKALRILSGYPFRLSGIYPVYHLDMGKAMLKPRFFSNLTKISRFFS